LSSDTVDQYRYSAGPTRKETNTEITRRPLRVISEEDAKQDED